MTKTKMLLLVGLVLVAGVLFLVADRMTRQENAVELPRAIRWYPVARATTSEAYMLEFDPNWLSR